MTTAAFTPIGDPEGMRALAQELMGRADLIATGAVAPASALSAGTFEGPAADRLRTALDDVRTDVLAAASRLRDVAATLAADAAQVERRNLDLEREAKQAAEAEAATADPAASESTPDPAASESTPDPAAGAEAPAAPAAGGGSEETPA